MPLSIGDKKLIPAPLVTIQRQINFAPDGSPLNTSYNISLDGTLLPNKGSPTSYGWHVGMGEPASESFAEDTEKFNAILLKQEWLREALAATGWKLSYSAPGLEPVECYPTLQNINFTPGIWVIKSDYQVSLQTSELQKTNTNSDLVSFGSGYNNLNLTSVADDFSVKERDDGTEILEVTRQISATSAFRFSASGNPEPWKNARTWVLARKASVPFNSGFIDVIFATGLVYSSGTSYNLIEEESINQLAGQYSLSQKFLFHYRNYIDNRVVSRNTENPRLGDGAPTVTTITVNGTIVGLDANAVPANKYANASGYWATASGLIGSSVGAVGNPTTYNVTSNFNEGIIEYQMSFINNSGSYYKHNYDVSYNVNQENPTVTINGTIEGYTPDDFYYGTAPYYTKFDNAVSGWAVVSGIVKSLAFSYSSLTPTGSLFSNSPLNRSISYNKPQGTINYTYVYAYTSGVNTNYQHTYTIDLSTDNANPNVNYAGVGASVTVNGEIIGLDSSGFTSKIANAKTGWSAIHPTLYSLANAEYSLLGTYAPTLASGFARKSISLDTIGGKLGYSVTFNNNQFMSSSSGVAVEDVQVEDVNPNDVFAVHIIPGRSSGPIIQNIATTTEYRRTVNINLTMYPKGSTPYYWSYSDKSVPATIASGILATLVPAGIRGSGYWFAGDTESWNFKGGLYSRAVNITY